MTAVQQKLLSSDRIRIAAKELFATRGFHQTSMSELANAADMSVGLIYRSFKSKADIIEAIVGADFHERLASLECLKRRLNAGEITIQQTFEELFVESMSKKDEALAFDIIAEGFRNECVGRTIGEKCVQLRAHLRDFALAANSRLHGEELEAAAEFVLGCLFGLGHRSVSWPTLNAECTAKVSARMVVAALEKL